MNTLSASFEILLLYNTYFISESGDEHMKETMPHWDNRIQDWDEFKTQRPELWI